MDYPTTHDSYSEHEQNNKLFQVWSLSEYNKYQYTSLLRFYA